MTTPEKVLARFQKTSYLRPGHGKEVGEVRIHRFMGSIVVWDLKHAGKRGKKVEKLVVMSGHLVGSQRSEEEILDGVASMIEGKGTFNSIVSTINDYVKDYPGDLSLHTYFERGVDVTPAGFKKIEIKTSDVYIEADYDGFRVKNLRDTNNEPTCIPSSKGGKKSIPQFYRWVRDNESKIKRMTYHEVLSAMSREGMKYHSYCAMD